MLRLLYLAFLYKKNGGQCDVFCRAETAVAGTPRRKWEVAELKARLTRDTVSSSLALSSIAADIDVVTDWFFYFSDEIQNNASFEGLKEVSLFFTLFGTLTWVLLATDCPGWLRNGACPDTTGRAGRYFSWPLLNVLLEDLPQLAITGMTTGFTTVAGAMNIAASVFSFLAKAAEALASFEEDDLPRMFHMTATAKGRVESVIELKNALLGKKQEAEVLAPLISSANADEPESMRMAWEVARDHHWWADQLQLSKIEFISEESDDLFPFLEGRIPKGLGAAKELVTLCIQRQNLSGSIPLELGDLANLETLNLSRNNLTGGIPNELIQLARLQTLMLNNNNLNGPIPARLGEMPSLVGLHLQQINSLVRPVPSASVVPASLKLLDLWNNELTGSIPDTLGTRTNLERVILSSNRIDGALPTTLANLTNLTKLFIRKTRLTGEEFNWNAFFPALVPSLVARGIPPQLSQLVKLKELSFFNNELSGPIPVEALSKLTNLTELDISENRFEEPDCTRSQESLERLLPHASVKITR
ncbi:unnamed protein product [Ectocarpus sp. 4 AP-2014]